MPTKKIGGRCKAGYIQTGRDHATCRQNPKYVKGHKSHAAQVARGVVSTYNDSKRWQTRQAFQIKQDEAPKKIRGECKLLGGYFSDAWCV